MMRKGKELLKVNHHNLLVVYKILLPMRDIEDDGEQETC